ncbi:ALBINO3-like protein 3, mitochondrial isoform X2 [Pistacia vera]|uniref:ALBINO3-like protein 3, mitochondrial isoform X2 n=1 Tax=Pistacia vera TaxID=55513 RepID=UPI00126357CA|nr:ALBINO3-like protein 3, mitochondrial isoform X2 [Pistacia vera]
MIFGNYRILNTSVLLCWKEHIRQLFISANPTEVENIDLLIVASQWAGVAYIRQGKMAEGIVHLERIANLEEPEEKSSKAHYYDGLVLLSRSQG